MTGILRKNFRRLLVAVLCLLASVLSCALPLRAQAQKPALPRVTVEDKTVHRGQTFRLNVTLEENPGLVSMILQLDYDKSVMSLVGVERGGALSLHTFTTTNVNTDEGYLVDPFRLLWDCTARDSSTGELVTLIFESKLTAPLGSYPVELTYDAKNTNGEYGQPVAVDIDCGTVTLVHGEHQVVYKNYDGSELQRSDYNDVVPAYTGETPIRSADERYSYTFSGWKGAVPDAEKEIWFVADYAVTPIEYQVTFYVDGEFFGGDVVGYGEVVDLTDIPSKQNHTFSGWYLDADFTQKVTFQRMPASDLRLYGYMRFNIREEEIPTIALSVDKIEEGVAFVGVRVTENMGLAGLVLTLDYDRTALTLIGYEQGNIFATKQFTTTNAQNGYDAYPFRFYWEHAENSYETGLLLTLKLRIDESVPAALYGVTVTYDEKTDATYLTAEDELWYTRLNIVGTGVPIGKIYHWYEETSDGIGIDVTTEEGQSPDTVLEIKRVSQAVTLPEADVIAVAGENMELKDVYTARLIRGGEEVEPTGKITVKIELTEAQAGCAVISVFNLDGSGALTRYESRKESGFVVFETDSLSGSWAIVGSVTVGVGGTTGEPTNTPILIISAILLAIATLAFASVLIARSKRNGRAFVYRKD